MPQHYSYWSLFLLFLRFGLFAWGGPVAQIAMIKEELVDKQGWITPEKFKRVLALYQALPGPEAHELCVYFGMIHKQRLGGFLAGLGFMLPGVMCMLCLSWCYQSYGAKTVLPLLAGIVPVVCALMVRATYRIGSHILSDMGLWGVAVLALTLSFLKVHFLFIFILCVVLCHLWNKGYVYYAVCVTFCMSIFVVFITLSMPTKGIEFSLYQGSVFIEGLKAGLLSFGGAYTAIPFLKNNMVDMYPHITQRVFFDGIALAHMIPAPLIVFGTYLGFITGGLGSAILITIGIFLPAFSFTLFGHDVLERIVKNRTFHSVLDAISAATVGILSVTTADIFIQNVTNIPALGLFIIALLGFYTIKSKWAIPLMIIICGSLYHAI